MFVRKKPNKSGSISVQIVDKSGGKYRVIKTVGVSSDQNKVDFLWRKAHYMIPALSGQGSLDFMPEIDRTIVHALSNDNTAKVWVTGPDKILGTIFDKIGFNQIPDTLFRQLVLARLVCPVSKLATTDYLYRYAGISVSVSTVYRFMDKLKRDYKDTSEQIAYQHTKKVLHNKIGVVFYDMTTLYFEAEYEDDFRRLGFSKDGKPQNPQILLGLLVGEQGYPIGYELFEGNKFEGGTLIPVLKQFQKKYDLPQPTVIADSGLLSKENIRQLTDNGYEYIIGARIKNESQQVKQQILQLNVKQGRYRQIRKKDNSRLIIGFTEKRARKDAFNRQKGLQRLEKKLKSGKLSKKHINNRGYNKYLKLKGEVKLEIDYEKFNEDESWDGLKGYLTNSKLSNKKVVENYNQLWQIEKAFRVSKAELKVRPVYHRIQRRIISHITISFCAYTVYKELERILLTNKADISPKRAIELTQTMYTLSITLPESQQQQYIELPLDDQQQQLCHYINT